MTLQIIGAMTILMLVLLLALLYYRRESGRLADELEEAETSHKRDLEIKDFEASQEKRVLKIEKQEVQDVQSKLDAGSTISV